MTVRVCTPLFSNWGGGLLNDRKRARKETKKSITFRQYLGGIHPRPLLAEVWLKRIIEMTVIEN